MLKPTVLPFPIRMIPAFPTRISSDAVAQWLRASNFDNCVSQHLSGAGSIPAGSVGRDLNLPKLNYQCLTTSVAVVLVVR